MARPGTAVFAAFAVAAYAVALLVLPQAASAMVIRMDLSDLARSADSVVIARVSNHSSRAVGPMVWRTRKIVSDSRIRVQRVLKGARSLDVTVTQPGGRIGDKTLVVSDLAEFRPGERAVLFLNAQGGVVGGYQGKLDIVGDQVPALGLSLAQVIGRVRADNGLPALPSREVAALSQPATAAAEVAAPSVSALTIGLTVSRITPGGLNAGIGDQVLITGTGFGAAAGTVTFPDGRGYLVDESKRIVSWTDSAIVCEIPQYAQSGSVVVTRAGATASGSFFYRTGFSTDGSRWADPAVSYRINENSPDLTGEGAAIQRAFATWNADGSRFRFSYSGTNSSTAAIPPLDGFNDVYFASTGFGDPNIVAWNQIWLDRTGNIIESDVIFNDATAPFGDGAVPGRLDVETVALHELGHTLCIDDQYGDYVYNEVMGAAVVGQTRRVLSQVERDGALYLYDGPTRPAVTSSSHPLQTAWYASTTASLSFASRAPAPAVVAGYSYVVDASPVTIPDTSVEGPEASYAASGLIDGVQWFHVRAVTSGGVWGPTTHYQLNIDAAGGVAEASALTLLAPTTVKYAATATLSGHLSALVNGALAGVAVSLEAMPYGSVAFTPVDSANTDAAGNYTFAVRPTVRTSYRVVFAGDARFLRGQSVARTILPAAWVSRPFAPASVSRARSYAVYGYLKPKHISGTSVVRVYRWRWNGRRWVSYGYVYARASATAAYPSYTKYSAALRFPYAGKWRVGAYHADAAHAATWATGFDYVTSR